MREHILLSLDTVYPAIFVLSFVKILYGAVDTTYKIFLLWGVEKLNITLRTFHISD